MIWGFIFCFLIFIKGYQWFRLLNSRADVIKLSKVVTSQKVCAVHTQTGEGVETALWFSQEHQEVALLLLPEPDHRDPASSSCISTVKTAVQVRSDCLVKTLLDWPWILANDGDFLTKMTFGEGLRERLIFLAMFAWVSPQQRNGWILKGQPLSPEPSAAASSRWVFSPA